MGRRTILMLVAIVVAGLGSTLVFLYVQGINDRAIADQNPVQVLTATDVIAVGESIDDAQSAGKLALTEVPRANILPAALTSTAGLRGQLALTTIYPGEQILSDKFGTTTNAQTLTIPKEKMAISVQLTDPARVAGFVNPGSHVAIFLSASRDGTKGTQTSFTRLLLADVEVIGVGASTISSTTTTTGTGTQTTEEVSKTILTLALSQGESERTIFGTTSGELSFGLLTDDSVVKPSDGISAQNLFG